MEKIQGEYHSNKNKNLGLTSIVASLVLSACGSAPTSNNNYQTESSIRYREVYVPVPVYTEPEKKLIHKTHTHTGSLSDKICTYIYNNGEKILKLCEPKPGKIVEKYSKTIPAKTEIIPGRTEFIPGKTTYIPGKTEPRYGLRYGLNPLNGKMEHHYGPTLETTPGKTEYTPSQNKYIPPKTQYIPEQKLNCTKYIPYNQTTGAEMSIQEKCN